MGTELSACGRPPVKSGADIAQIAFCILLLCPQGLPNYELAICQREVLIDTDLTLCPILPVS